MSKAQVVSWLLQTDLNSEINHNGRKTQATPQAKSRSVVLETRIFQVATFPSFALGVKSFVSLVNVHLPTIDVVGHGTFMRLSTPNRRLEPKPVETFKNRRLM